MEVFVFRNPLPTLIEAIAEQQARFVFRLASTLPRLEIGDVAIEHQGGEAYSVRATVVNAGYLATCLTWRALQNGAAEPVRGELQGDSVRVLDGSPVREVGHLAGRSERRMEWHHWGDPWGTLRKAVRWLVQGREGSQLSIRASCPRAGAAEADAVLALALSESR